MDLGIKGKSALVMASSKGLGKAVAKKLVREGANVMLCGRNEHTLLETRDEIIQEGTGKVEKVVCDLSQAKDRQELFEATMAVFGKIDLLVTNTGGPSPGQFEKFDMDDWKGFYNDIFLSAADMIKMVVPGMKQRQFGRVLTITSVSSKQPVDNLITSNVTRSSLLGLVKSLSNELAPHGITVNNIMPGYTLTDRLQQLMAGNPQLDQIKESIPMKRFGTVEEFAAAAVFLLSERASYITGQSLAVDGGVIKGY